MASERIECGQCSAGVRGAAVPMAWIETTHLVAEQRTHWRVIVGGEVVHKDVVDGDPAGIDAHEAAQAWILASGHSFRGWKHAIDRSLPDGGPIAAKGTERSPTQPKALVTQPREAWIETTYVVAEQRNDWRVVVAGEVVHKGSEPGDRAGARGYEAAHRWLVRSGLPVGGWSHAIDRTPSADVAPIVYGWIQCPTGTREAVAITAAQRLELATGALPCPVCGERCGAQLVPSEQARPSALSWTGTRWHAVLAHARGDD